MRVGIEELTAIDRPLSVAFSYQVLAAVLDAKGENVAASEALRLESAALRRAQATATRPGAAHDRPGLTPAPVLAESGALRRQSGAYTALTRREPPEPADDA